MITLAQIVRKAVGAGIISGQEADHALNASPFGPLPPDPDVALRDSFAKDVLLNILNSQTGFSIPWEVVARTAYKYADAMMKARSPCAHKTTVPIDPNSNAGDTVRCSHCGARKSSHSDWRAN